MAPLESRCLLSVDMAGLQRSGMIAHRMDVADQISEIRSLAAGPAKRAALKALLGRDTVKEPFYWSTRNVSILRHPSGAAAVEVSYWSSGRNPWDAIYGYSGFSLQAGATYEIQYGASQILTDNKNRTFRINLQEADAPFKSFFMDDAVGDGRVYTQKVTIPYTVPDASLQFQFGGGGHREFVFTAFSIRKV
ncbi:hypothetical protein [Paludisphaera rhizosphaerae]|uniref:hypothetical protein n=1 Tax=Paludisphaera rhizosphaerae TaxID=2711216 RepID=UPI00197EF8BA|nr:hypothetical protein [Paludisphaera rhizosphaerae]